MPQLSGRAFFLLLLSSSPCISTWSFPLLSFPVALRMARQSAVPQLTLLLSPYPPWLLVFHKHFSAVANYSGDSWHAAAVAAQAAGPAWGAPCWGLGLGVPWHLHWAVLQQPGSAFLYWTSIKREWVVVAGTEVLAALNLSEFYFIQLDFRDIPNYTHTKIVLLTFNIYIYTVEY